MCRIAVLLCMAAGTPRELEDRALRSTAAGLDAGDEIFVYVDGGEGGTADGFAQVSYPVRVTVLGASERRGLACGLNVLLQEVLRRGEFDLLARMDADDESWPDRFREQRAFLTAHPDVDVLGGGCREVDENGNLLQEKSMPTTHDAILRALPQRNPINHPTVIVRRRVFESGLRYREDVGRMEDYHLWVDVAAAGFRFANLPGCVLNFRRDSTFFRRRGGWELAGAEFAVRWRAMNVLRARTPVNLGWAMAAWILRVLPPSFQQGLYRVLR